MIHDVINQAISDLQELQQQLQSTSLISAVPETKEYFKNKLFSISSSLTDVVPEVDTITE